MALSLPQVRRRQIQRVSSPDPSSYVKEANSRAAALSAIGRGAEQVTKLTQEYVRRATQRDVRDATLAVHKEDASFVASKQGVEEFNIMEVDDDNFIELADQLGYEDPERSVPSHRIYSEWRAKNMKDSINRAASRIPNMRAREKFVAAQTAKLSSQYASDSATATKEQIKYVAQKTMANVEQAILKRDFPTARLEVEMSEMSSAAKGRANKDIDTREQVDYFNETIEKRVLPVMKNALNQLVTNDAKVTSELAADTQKVFANQLRAAIGSEENAISAGANSQLKLMKDDLETQRDDTWGNKSVNLPSMLNNMRVLKEKYPVLVREAEWTLANQPIVSSVLQETPEEQAAIYKHAVETAGGDMERSYMVSQLGKAIDEGNRARQTDAMKWASDTGFIVKEPMDYSSPAGFEQSLSKRLRQVTSIQDNYHAFTGFFTQPELAEFGNRVENASIKDKLNIFGGVHRSLGESASALYEQLKEYGIAGTAALAGQLMARGPGNEVVAENILTGADLRSTNVVTQLEVKEADLDHTIVEKFGMMFAGNKKHQSLMAEAFKDVWAVTKNSDTAFKQLAGNTVEFEGSVIQAPPGIGDFKYKWHIYNIIPGWWGKDSMKAHGYTPEQLRDGVLDGSLKQIGMGEGVNHLMKPKGDTVRRPDGVIPLPFNIDMSEPTRWSAVWDRQEKHFKDVAAQKEKLKREKAAAFQKMWDSIGGGREGVKGGRI